MSGALRRSLVKREIAGVCGGLAEYFSLDVTMIRVLWVLAAIFGLGSPILIYVVMWILIPERDYV